MAVRFMPARTIGGDLYDFLDYGPERTAIVLGDVSESRTAALFAALVSGIIALAARMRRQRRCWLRSTTRCRNESSTRSMYRFCLRCGTTMTAPLRVANSGAVQPVVCRQGQSITIKAEGFPLGLFPM